MATRVWLGLFQVHEPLGRRPRLTVFSGKPGRVWKDCEGFATVFAAGENGNSPKGSATENELK